MHKRLEIIEKDITRPKLTVAKDRVTIKFPLGTSPEVKCRVLECSDRIVKDLVENNLGEYTLRGSFEEDFQIRLANGHSSLYIRYGPEGERVSVTA